MRTREVEVLADRLVVVLRQTGSHLTNNLCASPHGGGTMLKLDMSVVTLIAVLLLFTL